MNATRATAGFALPLALSLTFCAALLLGGVLSYASSAARQSALYAGRSACRLAALGAIEMVRGKAYEAFLSKTGNKSLLFKSESLDWFTSTAAGSDVLGTGSTQVNLKDIEATARVNFPGYGFKLRIGSKPSIQGTFAIVTYLATASNQLPSGVWVSSTIAERVSYGVDRSKVFDHAYFVNNYGWFNGSTITANGAVRANGDMSIAGNPKVNGDVYAAPNDELNVLGNITDGIGNMDSKSTYRTSQYGVTDRARPLQANSGDGGYDAPDKVTDATKNARLHAKSHSLDMPWISDLNQYVEYGRDPQIQSTLSQGGVYYIDNRTSNKGKENYGYYTGTGPSGDANMPDNHALVLEGTAANPIVLNGPVVVSNDVVIKGVVTGQGTIYSQRNIHIVGNITYKNPPNWSGKTAAANNGNVTKDLLGLAAKGNIVMGDSTQSAWLNSVKSYISTQPYVQKYKCAEDETYSTSDPRHWGDGDIGYPRRKSSGYTTDETVFGGNYTVVDGGAKVKETKTEKFHYETTKDRYGRTTQKKVSDGYEYTYSKDTSRKYYESVVPPSAISSRASEITQIDAVLYNNHGIFGKIGSCTINGSLVCRNEGMIFSGSLFLNWDYRLYSGSPESVANSLVGMPVSASLPTVLSLQEVPDGWNK